MSVWYAPPAKIGGTEFVMVRSYVLDMNQTYHTISLRHPTHNKIHIAYFIVDD